MDLTVLKMDDINTLKRMGKEKKLTEVTLQNIQYFVDSVKIKTR